MLSVGGAAPSPHHNSLFASPLRWYSEGAVPTMSSCRRCGALAAPAACLLPSLSDGTARALYLLFRNEQREVVGGKMLRVSDDIRHVFLEILGIPHQTVEALSLPHTPFHAHQFIDKV